jgi:hypothetical protein
MSSLIEMALGASTAHLVRCLFPAVEIAAFERYMDGLTAAEFNSLSAELQLGLSATLYEVEQVLAGSLTPQLSGACVRQQEERRQLTFSLMRRYLEPHVARATRVNAALGHLAAPARSLLRIGQVAAVENRLQAMTPAEFAAWTEGFRVRLQAELYGALQDVQRSLTPRDEITPSMLGPYCGRATERIAGLLLDVAQEATA